MESQDTAVRPRELGRSAGLGSQPHCDAGLEFVPAMVWTLEAGHADVTRGEAARAGGASGASTRTTGGQERRTEGGVGVASTPLGQGGFNAALRDALGMVPPSVTEEARTCWKVESESCLHFLAFEER